MGKKVVLILRGGGGLGAFQCGAWNALFPYIRDEGHELIAVAGASIGAVNAALITRHYQNGDGGRDVLQDFWRHSVATPSMPFLPFRVNMPVHGMDCSLACCWETGHSFIRLTIIGTP